METFVNKAGDRKLEVSTDLYTTVADQAALGGRVFEPTGWEQAHAIADALKAAWPVPKYYASLLGDNIWVVRDKTHEIVQTFDDPEPAARELAASLNAKAV